MPREEPAPRGVIVKISLLSSSRYKGELCARIECPHLRHGEPLGLLEHGDVLAVPVAVDNEVELLFGSLMAIFVPPLMFLYTIKSV